MEKAGHIAMRWRYGVVALEMLLAAGCLYFGWNVVAAGTAAVPIRVQHAATAAGALGEGSVGALAVPVAGAGSGRPATVPGRVFQAPNLSADWLSRVNADDYDLYRGQWQTLQLLMSGVRQYLEQRVVPRLLGN